ncbi:MAG TPA: Holliday junction branch migration protein RuvA [Gemmatimonadaceae bacterium]|nr:Holliday junction branch migration protein RuvA [Gemmatimonadaceae bacterium]
MISRIRGTLEAKELDRVEIATPGGVGYMLQIPLSVYETLPSVGEPVSLYTSLIVKEDGWQLFGFASQLERRLFDLVRTANGVGPALALSLLSSLTAARLVRAIVEKDTATLQSVPRVGKKKAEQMILDLATKMRDVDVTETSGGAPAPGAAAEDAIRALVSLGYSLADAERAVRATLDASTGPLAATDLIRNALARIAAR